MSKVPVILEEIHVLYDTKLDVKGWERVFALLKYETKEPVYEFAYWSKDRTQHIRGVQVTLDEIKELVDKIKF